MELTSSLMTKVLGPQLPAVQKQMAPVGPGAAVFSAAAFSEGTGAMMRDNELRNWYETNPWLFALVNQRCEDVSTADWEVRQIDPTGKKADPGVLRDIINLFESPNPEGRNDSYASWVHPMSVDTLCLDKGATLLRMDGGVPYALEALDGARVRPKPGWQKASDGPRYFYMDEGRNDGIPLENDELMLVQAHPSTYRLDGLAPLKVLSRILIAEYDAFKSVHILQKNRAPSAILKMPGASKDSVETAKSLWLNELAGRSGLGFMAIPSESDLMVLGSTDLEAQGAFKFYDILIKAMAAVFRSATLNLNWLEDVNRATASESANVADDGTVATLKLYQGFFNREIVAKFPNSENIGFFFTQLPRDEALSITRVREMAGRVTNPWSINQMLVASGYNRVDVSDPEEQEYYDKPLIGVANGQMAPPSTARKLPQYQELPAPAAPGQLPAPVDTSRPNNDARVHPVDQVVGAIPARASLDKPIRKGTPERDLQDATTTLFDEIDAIFAEAQETARSVVREAE